MLPGSTRAEARKEDPRLSREAASGWALRGLILNGFEGQGWMVLQGNWR